LQIILLELGLDETETFVADGHASRSMFSEVRHTSVCISKERQSDFIVKGINVSHFSIEVFYIKTVRGVLPVLHTSIL